MGLNGTTLKTFGFESTIIFAEVCVVPIPLGTLTSQWFKKFERIGYNRGTSLKEARKRADDYIEYEISKFRLRDYYCPIVETCERLGHSSMEAALSI